MTWRPFLTALLAAGLLLAGPCSRINQTNFQKVQDDMTYEQVVAILGAPTETKSVGIGPLSATTAEWRDSKGALISIQFLNDKVKLKSFSADPPAPAP